MPWTRALEALGRGLARARRPRVFLGTVRPDGRPHAAGVGVAHVRRRPVLHQSARPRARRATSRPDPSCTLSLRLPGIDLVFEGRGATARPTRRHSRAVAAAYAAGGWPAEVDGDALTAPYSAQSAGPGPWHLYRLRVRTCFGVGLRPPHGASRWNF